MKDSEIVVKAREYVKDLFEKEFSDKYTYHNFQHTADVVEASLEIGEKAELSPDEMEMVVLSAWLHDTGYRNGSKDHEEESKNIASTFLKENNYPERNIDSILSAIEATKMPQKPKNLVAEVLCDADLYHLSTKQFEKRSFDLKNELEANGEEKIEDSAWLEQTISFAKGHTYFTNYGQLVLQPRKVKNLKKLKKEKKKLKGDMVMSSEQEKYVDKLESEIVKLKNRLDRERELKPTRGIETMFRTTSRNHLTLSGMADNKANIMISVNSIILSILLTVLFRKFGEYPNLVIPALALLLTSLSTIIFSILATRPNVSQGIFTVDDIRNKKTNLLFFGNFHRMKIDNYLWGMREMMKDGEYLYGSLIKDIYYLGVVLGKKYRLLRISYTVFMFGLIVSILLFVLAQAYPATFSITGAVPDLGAFDY